jgi:hypothetical protein
MSFVTRHARVLALAVSCLGVGAGASAIASAGASTTSTPGAKSAAKVRRQAGRGELRRAVHGEFVIHTKKGFETVALDRGFVQAVNGDVLTLHEGTKTATYKTVTLTLASSARVRNNRQRSSLSTLKPGERVQVIQGPAHTLVVARAAK